MPRRRAGRVAARWRRLNEVGRDPDYRFSLANERTFLAWIRTSLALLAGGIAVKELIPSFGVPGGRLAMSIALIALSTLLSTASYLRWRRNELAMRLDATLPRSFVLPVLAVGLSVVTLLAFALVLAGR